MEKTLLATALVGRTHGLEGYVRIESLSGDYEHLADLDECVIETKDKRRVNAEVESVKMHQDCLLMRFCGYPTPEKARVLSGGVMYITRDRAPELEEGEYYIADLYGCSVIVDGERVGEITDTSEGAQALLLHVKRDDGRIFLVPNMKPFVSEVDTSNGKVILANRDLLE